MTLSVWIQKTGQGKVAKLLGVDPSTVHYWKTHASAPQVQTCFKIVRLTRGQVSYADIIEPFCKAQSGKK